MVQNASYWLCSDRVEYTCSTVKIMSDLNLSMKKHTTATTNMVHTIQSMIVMWDVQCSTL